ncbi:MAG: preprotein translocase subunit YajC [Chitinivibrionales bacterium]|nr:preprotein translocase subunit YajC [Chitinivibrionales bacterium]MBD3395110.1 preprotein translocase subunit YajC [Chitinivibrionales bacterium]
MRFLFATAIVAFPGLLFAQGGEGSPTSMFGSVLPMMLVMFAIIYFLMIRPEQKKQKQRQKMISEMKKGDKVLTVGGICGSIVSVKGENATVKIAENVTVEVTKSAISSVINKEGTAKETREKT